MISINATLFVQIINLLVLMFILNRLLYKPVRALAAKREQQISAGRQEADNLWDKSLLEQDAYKKKRGEGRAEIRRQIEDFRRQTEARVNEIIATAQADAKVHEAKLLAEIDAQFEDARRDVAREARQLSQNIAQIFLDRGLA